MTDLAAKSFDMKAAPMTAKQLDRWLEGEISRRILVVPFGGPIPSEKSSLGVDIDDEWFDSDTDIYGPYAGLRTTRRRMVDWHHDDFGVPAKGKPTEYGAAPDSMKGAIIGEIELDEEPEEDGYWADWWARAGDARKRRIALLEKRGVPLYGSSQAIFPVRTKGHIDIWPLVRHTITTSPNNPYAVVPPLKGLLDDLTPADLTGDAWKALLVGLSELVPDLRSLQASDDRIADPIVADTADALKAGRVLSAANEKLLNAAIDSLAVVLSKLQKDQAASAAEGTST